MGDTLQSLTGFAGLLAWLGVVLVMVGVPELMRFLANRDGLGLGFRQLLLIVAASVVLLALAGAGGLALMHAA
ncbi:MAG TPA: hypothetical protein VEU32_13585 [Burkholderiales bacterium]|nr:hypothetical protein [Burkholderiales bacterium]